MIKSISAQSQTDCFKRDNLCRSYISKVDVGADQDWENVWVVYSGLLFAGSALTTDSQTRVATHEYCEMIKWIEDAIEGCIGPETIVDLSECMASIVTTVVDAVLRQYPNCVFEGRSSDPLSEYEEEEEAEFRDAYTKMLRNRL